MGQWGTLIPLILMFVVFYFFLIRPQQKRQKERTSMLNSLKKGDKVITIGGIHGKIVELGEERVTLKVSDNTRLVFERSSINSVVSEEQPDSEKESMGENK